MAGGVGDDVLAPAGGEVAVGDVDGDALLALGLQAVGEQRQVDRRHAAPGRGFFHGVEGVGKDGLAVEEQAANQGAFAVVYAAASQKAQQAIVDFGEVFEGGHGFYSFRLSSNSLADCLMCFVLAMRRGCVGCSFRRLRNSPSLRSAQTVLAFFRSTRHIPGSPSSFFFRPGQVLFFLSVLTKVPGCVRGIREEARTV